MDEVIKQGRVAADTRTSSPGPIGIAIRAGAARPDINHRRAFKRALMDANRSPMPRPARAGVYFASLLPASGHRRRKQCEEQVMGQGTRSGEAVAPARPSWPCCRSRDPAVQGAEVLGPVAAELQSYVVMTAGNGMRASQGARRARPVLKGRRRCR